jgi:transcriptional regulator with XRE-family HTH domain
MPKLPKYNTNKIATNIKKLRVSMELSREELAKKAKVNYNTIIKLESGANKNPTVNTLIGISKVFNVPVQDLLV